MRPYQQAKHDADEALAGSSLDWTIVRPGRLTDAPGSGARRPGAARSAATARSRARTSPRCCWRCSSAENTVRGTYELLGGDVPVDEAVKRL